MSSINAGPIFGFVVLGVLIIGFIAVGVAEAREDRRERKRP